MPMKLKQRQEPEDLQPWEVAVAKTCVKDFLERGYHIDGMEPDDLLQECLVLWVTLKRTRKLRIDVRRPARAFMAKVLSNKLHSLSRRQKAKKRSPGQPLLSLHSPFGPDDSDGFLIDMLADPDAEAEFELHETRRRVRQAMARLTGRRQEVCRLLSDGYGVAEIANTLGLSRPSVYADIEGIREVFEDESLEEFLA
jgi:RNA polymerase sigma factor (sigma-70 family)